MNSIYLINTLAIGEALVRSRLDRSSNDHERVNSSCLDLRDPDRRET